MNSDVGLTTIQKPKAKKTGAKSKPEMKSTPREIPGNFPYTTSHGVLKQILQKIVEAERPSKFSGDFLNTVLGFSGGSAAVVPPILKRTGFLSADATPTDQYNRFKSDGGRSQAALDALRTGFSELFRRNEYAHKFSEEELKDQLVAITGLNKSDSIIRAIAGTFLTFKSFFDPAKLPTPTKSHMRTDENSVEDNAHGVGAGGDERYGGKIGLAYNINIVIPNTDDPNVLNAIFKSLRENLLR